MFQCNTSDSAFKSGAFRVKLTFYACLLACALQFKIMFEGKESTEHHNHNHTHLAMSWLIETF